MIWKMINDSVTYIKIMKLIFGKMFPVKLLIILHAISTFNAKYISTSRSASPIKIPIILRIYGMPIFFLKITN